MFNNTIFGIIYLIKHKTCDDTKKVYIGSTIDLKNRIKSHRHNCNNEKNEKYNYKLYQYIRENGGFNEYEFIILECYVFNHNHELLYKEDDYIKMYDNNLNSKRAYLTDEEYKKKNNEKVKKYREEHIEERKEYNKKWYENNKEEINEKNKKYRENNKEKISQKNKEKYNNNKDIINEQRKKEKITCECGSIVRKNDITRHRKSLKHIAYIEQKNNVIYN